MILTANILLKKTNIKLTISYNHRQDKKMYRVIKKKQIQKMCKVVDHEAH